MENVYHTQTTKAVEKSFILRWWIFCLKLSRTDVSEAKTSDTKIQTDLADTIDRQRI
jgi:hypothetical protein